MAPQLIAVKALSDRTPSSWMARATSSLPDPDGPQSSTEAFERATRRIISRSRSTAGLCPMISVSSADGAAPYASVAQVMARLSAGGFTKLNLITDTAADETAGG